MSVKGNEIGQNETLFQAYRSIVIECNCLDFEIWFARQFSNKTRWYFTL